MLSGFVDFVLSINEVVCGLFTICCITLTIVFYRVAKTGDLPLCLKRRRPILLPVTPITSSFADRCSIFRMLSSSYRLSSKCAKKAITKDPAVNVKYL